MGTAAAPALLLLPPYLHILVEVMHPRHVGRTVAHHQVRQPRLVALTKLVEYRLP